MDNGADMKIFWGSIFLWIILFIVGLWLSMHKPLWCDELYGQKITVEGNSWGNILTGRIIEGNNFPLFFVLQKALMTVIHVDLPNDLAQDFELPMEKRKYNRLLDPKGQIMIRLLPNVLMTTAIVCLVRFFLVRDGLVVALMALLSALSSMMIWCYWDEARPYSLWFLLTLLQALFLMKILSGEFFSRRSKIYWTMINGFLALAATMGFLQVIIAQVILYFFGQRRLRDHGWAGILPVGAALYLAFNRHSDPLFIAMDPIDIIRSNFSYEQVALLFFYLIAFFFRGAWSNRDVGLAYPSWKGIMQLPNLCSGFCLSVLILGFIHWHWHGDPKGIPVFGRHLFFLSALSMLMVPALFSDLWSNSKGKPFWRVVFGGVFILVLFSQLIEGFTNGWFGGFFS